jgi:hypothetical protein
MSGGGPRAAPGEGLRQLTIHHISAFSRPTRARRKEMERRHLAGGAPAPRRQQLPSRSGTTAARLTRRRALGESRRHRIPAAGHREVAPEPMTIIVCALSAKSTPPLLSAVERSRRSWGGCVVPRATCRRATARVVLPPKGTRAGAPADHSSRFKRQPPGRRRSMALRRRPSPSRAEDGMNAPLRQTLLQRPGASGPTILPAPKEKEPERRFSLGPRWCPRVSRAGARGWGKFQGWVPAAQSCSNCCLMKAAGPGSVTKTPTSRLFSSEVYEKFSEPTKAMSSATRSLAWSS